MKDRIERKNRKKPSHKIFHTMIFFSVFTACFSVLFSFLFLNLTKENNTLNQKIENYSIQIDMMKNSEETNHYKLDKPCQ